MPRKSKRQEMPEVPTPDMDWDPGAHAASHADAADAELERELESPDALADVEEDAANRVQVGDAALEARIRLQIQYSAGEDVQVVHHVFRHLARSWTSPKEAVGRVRDAMVLDIHDVAERFGPGYYEVRSYYSSDASGTPTKRVSWRARVSDSYRAPLAPVPSTAVATPAVGVMPSPAVSALGGAIDSLEAGVQLLTRLAEVAKIFAPPAGGTDAATQALVKGMEGMMAVYATGMKAAMKVQVERMTEEDEPEPAPAPERRGGLDLESLLDQVGGVPGILRLIQDMRGGRDAE